MMLWHRSEIQLLGLRCEMKQGAEVLGKMSASPKSLETLPVWSEMLGMAGRQCGVFDAS